MPSQKLRPGIQEAIVSILLFGKSFRQIQSLLSVKDFDPPFYTRIASAAFEYIDQYKTQPKDHTLDLFEKLKEENKEDAETFQRIFESILDFKDGLNEKYLIDQAELFSRSQRMKGSLALAIDHLQRGEVDEADGVLRKGLNARNEISDEGVLFSDPKQSLSFLHSREFETLPTGITEIDNRGLGPVVGGLHLFGGLTGAGKSWWLLNLAKVGCLARKRVLYISLELSRDFICQRAMQSFFSITKRKGKVAYYALVKKRKKFSRYKRVLIGNRKSLTDDDIESYLTDKLGMRKNKTPFLIKDYPSGQLRYKQLEGYLDFIADAKGFYPDLVLIDYPDLMNLEDFGGKKDHRLALGRLFVALRGLATERNLAIAVVSQLNRSARTKKLARDNDIAEDYSKVATSDVLITYNQTPAEHKRGLARLYVAKGRTDIDKFIVIISQAYQMGQFVMRSIAGSDVPGYWDTVEDEDD